MLYVEIRIAGSLDEHWSSWFGDLVIVPAGAGTRLVGLAADQATLYGLLARLRDLAIPLRGVDSVALNAPTAAGGGLIWGGGWIEAPAGACPDHPALSGRAEFSFGFGWEAGGVNPDGRLRFQFAAANLNFTSSVIERVAVQGAQVCCSGLGCLNAQGHSQFWLAVVAGSPAEGGGRWRLRLVAPDGQTVAFDNEPDRREAAEPVTRLAAGRITAGL